MAALKDSLIELRRDLATELQAAGPHAVREAYERLAGVYAAKAPADAMKAVELWVETFRDWPLCALKQAVKAWAKRDTAFMPTTGQFHACGEDAVDRLRADLGDVRHILRVMDNPEDKDWDSFVADPEVSRKLRRLMAGLRNGENLRDLRRRGEI